MMNPTNAISQIKRLIGLKFNDPELQRDLKSLPFTVTEGPHGYPLIHERYLGEIRSFTPTQILGMVLSNLKGIAEKNLNSEVVDCCIGIPAYFTDLQRRAVLDAATIAGLHPLRLIHETTATALAYGIYKTDLPENDQLNVAFVDIGHASMQVCIAGFKKGQLKILAHAFDRSLGGRDFDEVLFQHFAVKFKEDYKIDVFQNARVCLRLRAACEKLKKMLSANPEAPLCLMDEKVKRDEFEQMSIRILERVKRPLEKALGEAGLTVENVHMVEVVGSGSRIPAIIKILTEFFRKEPRRTMNASESVARGCALQCAILSPTFKVREFQVNESFPFPIALSWKSAAPDTQNGASDNQHSTIVFPKGNQIPSVKALTFYRSGIFSVDVQYADVGELQAPAKISTYTIGPFQSTKAERAKLKVKVRLNVHGIVSIESATLLEEEEVEGTKMETDIKVGARKKKVKKTKIPVAELVYGGMIPVDLQKAVEKEFEMALQDRVMEETKDRKNAVEAYVYDMRNKLSDKYQEFVTDSEREGFISLLQKVEDWSYEDGEDETKCVYIAKLEELKKQGDPIEERYKEYVNRGAVIDQLVHVLNSYREAAVSNDPRFDHIDISEKQKVVNECVEAEAWLREKKQQQDMLPKYATSVLLSTEVLKKTQTLDGFCKSIMTKPRPALAKPVSLDATPTPPPDAGEQQPQGGDMNADASSNVSTNEKLGDPIEERCKDYVNRGVVIGQLVQVLNSYREAAVSNDPRFDHIDISEKQKVVNECVEAEAWLREKKQQQDTFPKYATSVLLSAEVLKKTQTLDGFCKPIMTRPRPAPTKPATLETPPTPPPDAGEQQPQGGDVNADACSIVSTNKRVVCCAGLNDRACKFFGWVNDPPMCDERVLKRLQEKYEWLKDENERLKAAMTKSETMEIENSKYKANMDMEVAQSRMQLAFEKEKYQLMEKHYQIVLAFSFGFLFLFLSLYVILGKDEVYIFKL